MRVGSLFSGIGGLDLGLEMTGGFRTVWFSEIEPYPCEVLAHHWPEVPNLGDITKIDWREVPPVDIICGGFPCQDVSVAGKRAGVKDGTRSGLWSEFARATSILRPQYVLIENVPGLLSVDAGAGLNRVLSDLAEMLYDAEGACVSAADVGAPHRRERLFIVAYTDCHRAGKRSDGRGERRDEAQILCGRDCPDTQEPSTNPDDRCGDMEDSDRRGLRGQGIRAEQPGRAETERSGEDSTLGNPDGERVNGRGRLAGEAGRQQPADAGCELADPAGNGRRERRPESAARERRSAPASSRYQRIFQPIPRSAFWDSWELSHALRRGPDGLSAGVDGDTGVSPLGTPRATDYKGAGPAGSKSAQHLEDRGYLTGQVANMQPQMWRTPQGHEPGIDIERLETKDGRPARLIPPGIPLLETGRKRRVAKLKALGNAIVPQCAEYVGRCILAHAQRKEA